MCRGHSVEGYEDTRWKTGLWSTKAKVEGIVLKVAWHWGSDGSVVNDLPGEPVRTPLNVDLPSTCGSADGDRRFSHHFVGKLLNWGL